MNSAYVFHPFDPRKPLRIYRRDLPHWRQHGATYFVTTRLADSIPASVLRRWQHEREAWYAAHGLHNRLDTSAFSRVYQAIPKRERQSFERLQVRRLFAETDRGHGSCLLRQHAAQILVADALRHFDNQRCHVGDFIVMPNHLHLLMQPLPSFELEQIMQSIKRWTSTRIDHQATRRHRLWQPESHDHLVRDWSELRRIRKYIEANPGKAHLDGSCTHYRADWADPSSKERAERTSAPRRPPPHRGTDI